MVSPLFDPGVVQKKIDELAQRDAEFAKLAESREQRRQLEIYGSVREYEFPPNTSQIHMTNWVHAYWLRPVRFIYRNMPRGLRKILKRLSVR